MNEPTLDRLTPRLDRLERENRRLKLAGAILLLALAAVAAMGQALPKVVPKVVEAERFVLRGTRGEILATLGMEAFGVLRLSLYDQNGKVRALLGFMLPNGNPLLLLVDQNEKVRAGLSLMLDGTPGLSLSDQNGKERAGLGVLVGGSARLSLSDQNEKRRAVLNVGVDGTPGLALFDQNGKERAGLSVDTSGPGLVLRDENQNNRAVLGHTALEGIQTGTVIQRPASSLVLFDKDGKVLWKAP